MPDTDERVDAQFEAAYADANADCRLLVALVAARKAAGLSREDVAAAIAGRARGDAKKALKKVVQYESGQNMHNVSLWYVRAYGRAVGVRVTSEVVVS